MRYKDTGHSVKCWLQVVSLCSDEQAVGRTRIARFVASRAKQLEPNR